MTQLNFLIGNQNSHSQLQIASLIYSTVIALAPIWQTNMD